ncbi:antitoxin [Aeromicrobium piscarium]|uniref:Antitoxin n=1 Tax=Aeromicrobium piscarium TaxID=2590901 RepID=A0A554S9V2_9ACTN|nr:antitoxin [Aeromicrobium piscarium]TSD63113.1 antitoxin [Aeromicrobium piscarium]
MSFLSKMLGRGKMAGEDLSQKAQDAKERAGEAMQGREDDIHSAVDKVRDLADQATGGKFTGKIDEAADRLKQAADDMATDDGGENDPKDGSGS